AHSSLLSGPEVWTAFYSLDDYQRGSVEYSDKNDLIDIQNYDMVLDLRDHKKHLNLKSRIDAQALATFRVLDLKVGEDLSDDDDWRLNKQLRVKSLKVNGNDAPFVQEDWEGGFAVFLSDPISARSKFVLEIELDGDFIEDANDEYSNCHYPRSNQSWFPRHGYLDRATFNLTYRHPKKLHIASSGLRISEDPDPEDKDAVVTKYQMAQPVPLVTFALAPFQRHADTIKWDNGAAPTPLEFNSLSSERKAVNEKFILQEMSNSVRYFNALFGAYPYPAFSAALHPFGFGQGFPSLLMIPSADDGRKQTYQFIAHETAHQWWGGIVAWRSYRDQWLSEGFAEYSGILFTGRRLNVEAQNDLLRWTRNSLTEPPSTVTGL
ncbi:MAG TPA: M1 family aminopeptidase, partial [Pyrinomonadaceae bacterium]